MSLLSNRGRFSSDEKNNFLNDDKRVSSLSSIGKNPKKLFKIESKKYPEKEKVEFKIPKGFYDNEFVSKHNEYNKKVDAFNEKQNKDIEDLKNKDDSITRKKKKMSFTLIITMVVVELFTLIAIVGLGTFIRLSNMTQKVTFDKAAVKNTNIDESTLAVMKGFKTVAIFGVDSRTGSVDKGNNADVNIIANLNLETGEAELVSVYRDLYLSVTDNNTYDKLNAAYRRGGPEAAVKALNKNLDLNIENFFSFNWKAVADGIELLGGIDLEITKSEYKYMNAFIHETCIATGIDSKNPAAHYIKSAGPQHLDGVQAVAYGRLRLMDSDFQRVERQKRVIELCLQKAKETDLSRLRLIMKAVLPQIAYEFDMNEMLSIAKIVKNINIVASCGVPETSNVRTVDMGAAGDCVVPLSLEKAVKKLHEILFGDSNYEPSMACKRYSNRIIELRKKYEEENAIAASIKASEEAESLEALLNPSTVKKKTSKATGSNASSNELRASFSNANNEITNQTAVRTNAPGEENIVSEEYEEEPEENENIVETTKIIETTKQVETGMPLPDAPVEFASPASGPGQTSGTESINNASPVAEPGVAPYEQSQNLSPTPMPGGPSPTTGGSGGTVISGPPGSQ